VVFADDENDDLTSVKRDECVGDCSDTAIIRYDIVMQNADLNLTVCSTARNYLIFSGEFRIST